MTAPEFSRPVRIDTIGAAPKQHRASRPTRTERAALAQSFRPGGDRAAGRRGRAHRERWRGDRRRHALGDVTQSCVATGAPVAAHVEAPFALVFRPQPEGTDHDEEIELAEAELDTVFYEGGAIDVGEAVAETLALNLDPYPRAPDAEEALKAAGIKSEDEAGPFAALAGSARTS